MTYYDLLMKEVKDPHHDYDGDDNDGNIPGRFIKFDLMGDLFRCIKARRMLESEEYGGKELDWGSSGAELRKDDVIRFLNEFYSDEEERKKALSKVKALADDRLYFLYAVET